MRPIGIRHGKWNSGFLRFARRSHSPLLPVYIKDRNEDFKAMREYLQAFGLSVPTLYKQYTDVYEAGGVEFLALNVDPDFSSCIDGLVCAELDQLKPGKRKRYMNNQR